MHVISKYINPSYFLYPDDNPDHSKNLTGCKLDTTSNFFSGRSNSYYLQYPANTQADKETSRHKNIYLFRF